jgi:molybdopterin-guanine dinucleotide biosynthesis protein A
MRIFGLILAGGEGRRLGGADKALVVLGGRTLLSRAAVRLGPQVERLALSANGDPARFRGFGGPILPDAGPGRDGPMAGLLAGLDWCAAEGGDVLATVPVDTPFLPADLVARLAAAGAPAIAQSSGRAHPACGLWPVSLRAALRTALGDGERRLGRWAEAAGAARVVFAPAVPDPFLNINTPADLAEAERLVALAG